MNSTVVFLCLCACACAFVFVFGTRHYFFREFPPPPIFSDSFTVWVLNRADLSQGNDFDAGLHCFMALASSMIGIDFIII